MILAVVLLMAAGGCASQGGPALEVKREAVVPPVVVALAPVDLAYPQALPRRLADELLYIRDGNRETSYDYVQVSVVIDDLGTVVDAQPLQGIERYFEEAAALMLDQRYAPFVRDGRSTAARFIENVRVLPAERQPQQHVAFPEGALDTAVIRLSRGVCLGNCPIYEVSIDGNGVVTFDGQRYVAVERQLKYRVSVAEVTRLLDRFKAADFFSLDNDYQADVTDIPGFKVSLEYGGVTKSVIDYMGLAVGMPVSVVRLEEEIDRMAGVDRWLSLQPSTLAGLKDIGVVVDSNDLAVALACMADTLSDEEIGELLRLGVPANGDCPPARRH